jgi:shikimate kinase
MPEQPTPNTQPHMKLYLIGLPGSGKSFLGKKLAEALQLPFIDLDAVIEQTIGKSVATIFAEQGESYFREIEANTLRQQSVSLAFVLSCGGGTPCFHDNMKFINKNGMSVFVNTPLPDILLRMTQEQTDQRPLFAASGEESLAAKLQTLLQKRKPVYEQAHIIVSNSDVSVQEVLAKIQTIKS